jgi:hypothetical protein
MPERWNERRGSLQLTLVTMTFFRASIPTLANQFGYELRIGVGSLFGSAIPGDVGLYEENLAGVVWVQRTGRYRERGKRGRRKLSADGIRAASLSWRERA